MLRIRARTLASGSSLLLLAPLATLDAQQGRPPQPDSIAPRAAAVQPLANARSLGRAPSPYLSSDGRFVVLIAPAPTASALDTLKARSLGADCAARSAAAELPAEDVPDPVSRSGRYLVVVVSGAQKGTDECEIAWNLSPFSIWHAAWMPPADGATARKPLSARLTIDGAPVEPAFAYARPPYLRTANGWRRDGSQLRYYYDMSVLRPRSDGRAHEISLQIWDREPAPAIVDVDPVAAGMLTLQYAGWTLASSPSTEPAPRLSLSTSRPVTVDVARIADTARTDLITGGIRAAMWASSAPNASSNSITFARLVAAEALLATREQELGKAMVATIQHDRPCLVPPAGSSPTVVQLAAGARASARCAPVTPGHAALLSIVPGLGNLAVNDRATAAVGATAVVVTLASALMFDSQARSKYAEYTRSKDRLESQVIYNRASDLRGQRNVTFGIAAGFWIVDAISAAYGAHVHGERIARDAF